MALAFEHVPDVGTAHESSLHVQSSCIQLQQHHITSLSLSTPQHTAHGMWLNRYSAHPSPSPSPAPQRRPSHLAPGPLPHRPGLTPRSSSLSILTNGSTDSLPPGARIYGPTSNLRNQLDASPLESIPDPLNVLRDILGPSPSDSEQLDRPVNVVQDIDFGELSLQDFADAPHSPSHDKLPEQKSVEECTY